MPNSDIHVMSSPTCGDAHAQYVLSEQFFLKSVGADAEFKAFQDGAIERLLEPLSKNSALETVYESKANVAAYRAHFHDAAVETKLTSIQDIADPSDPVVIAATEAAERAIAEHIANNALEKQKTNKRKQKPRRPSKNKNAKQKRRNKGKDEVNEESDADPEDTNDMAGDVDEPIESLHIQGALNMQEQLACLCGHAVAADATSAAEAVAMEKSKSKKDQTIYRYGNKFLGALEDSRPLHPDIACKSYFNKVWRNDESARKLVPRAWMPFANCTICVAHRGRLASSTTAEERAQLYGDIEKHITEVRAEKGHYYDNRQRGRTEPKTYMSVIVDGADCTNHELPHVAEKSKLSSSAKTIKMHIYGALVHGFRAILTTIPDHEAQGNNVTIQIIWNCINQYYRDQKFLPEVLLLQLDNTTKQNKGQYLFAFLALLVHYGIFKKVVLAFLPVGHTHEDIDQLFGRLSIYLRAYNAYTRGQLGMAALRSFTFENQAPLIIHWDTIANYSTWVHPFLATENGTPSTALLTQFRHFRFVNRKEGPAVQARMRMASPMDEDGWRGLQELTNQTYLFPSSQGIPDVWSAFQKGELPTALVRPSPDTAGFPELLKTHLPLLVQTYAKFTSDHVRSLEKLIAMYTAPPAKWPWSADEMQFWFDGRHRIAASSGTTGLQKLQSLRAAGFLVIGDFYIVQPPTPRTSDTKPFWLGRLLRVDPDHNNVWMQWLEQDEELNPLTDYWEPIERAWLRNNDDTGVRCSITALHESVRLKPARRVQGSTKMKIYHDDLPKASYWANSFNNPDNAGEEDECPLPSQGC